jgi:hypothetical protein
VLTNPNNTSRAFLLENRVSNDYFLRFDAAIAMITTIITATTPPMTALLMIISFNKKI